MYGPCKLWKRAPNVANFSEGHRYRRYSFKKRKRKEGESETTLFS